MIVKLLLRAIFYLKFEGILFERIVIQLVLCLKVAKYNETVILTFGRELSIKSCMASIVSMDVIPRLTLAGC